MTKYEQINIGDSETITHTILQDDIDKFVNLCGDNNKLHTDKEFARSTTMKKPVVHGMIGASFISTIIGTKIPGDGALWYSQNLEFLLPVRVGDTLTITATVIKKNQRNHSIELETTIFNEYKQKVTTGIAKVKIIEPETKESKEDIKSHKKIALIIGATGGIGSSSAKLLAKEGYQLILHYHEKKEEALALKDKIEATTNTNVLLLQANLRSDDEVINMFNEIKRYYNQITTLINCTSTNFGNIKFSDLEWSDISNQITSHIQISFLITKYALPFMEPFHYGKIIFLTSQATEQFNKEWLHYTTAKSALNGFAKSLAIDLADKGIRVNLVSAGMTDTPLIANIPEKVKLLTSAKTPLSRIAKPEDIANAISYLSSDKSDFLTGETIRVNGGQVML